MSRFTWPGARRLQFADAGLRHLQPRLASALAAGKLKSPPAGKTFLVYGDGLPSSLEHPQANAHFVPLLVLEGPTPSNAERVPASLICISLVDEHARHAGGADGIAALLVSRASRDGAAGGKGFCSIWREKGLSCAGAGETAAIGPAGQALESLLRGKSGEGAGHPLWTALESACQSAGITLSRTLNYLLAQHSLWFSPYTGQPVSPEDAMTIYGTIYDHWQENDRPGHCFGAQYWNHPSIRATFSGRGGDVSFHETEADTIAAAKACSGRILSWAGRTSRDMEADCAAQAIPLTRIEDGFLRSVGLGAGLARGAMLAVDDLGIYYDPSRPSRLEVLLRERDLSEADHERGRQLIDLIRQARISKYNFGKSRAYEFPSGKTRVLVPGQVADDAAIRKSRSETIDCANTPNVNLDLLRLARDRNPDAFLVFKPHPDVETGLRKGKVTREEAMQFADTIAEDANIIDLIEGVDVLETFSSLSGFEALLRGKTVAVHGAPFYAGWGLCEDLTRIEGRGRRRTLAELVYLSLVEYARTIDPVTLLPCTPEFLITRLQEQRSDRKHLFITAAKRHASWLGRKLGL